MDEALTACAGIVERGDPDRFMAAMAAPVKARAVLFPIYAFNVEVARAPWLTQESMIAEMRLQWWRDVLEEIRTGRDVRRHEVATPLAGVLDAEGAGLLDQLIVARRWDIYRDPFEDMQHFREYLDHTSANLLLASARALCPTELPEDALRQAGFALGLANWLRAIPALESSGRIPLVEGTPDAVRTLAKEGIAALMQARKGCARLPKIARPALNPLWQSATILRQAERAPSNVASGSLELSPARSRLMLMRTAFTGRW